MGGSKRKPRERRGFYISTREHIGHVRERYNRNYNYVIWVGSSHLCRSDRDFLGFRECLRRARA
jgi:hypothetical protein